jgi:hypothetical protein
MRNKQMKIWEKQVFETKNSFLLNIAKMQNEIVANMNNRLVKFKEFKKQCEILLKPVLNAYKMKKMNFPNILSKNDKLIINMNALYKIEFSFDVTSNSEIVEVKEYKKNENPQILGYLTLTSAEKEIKEVIKRGLNEYANYVSKKLKEIVLENSKKVKYERCLQLGIPLKLLKEIEK